MVGAKLKPSCVSRTSVFVTLFTSTSISPDCSAVNRLADVAGTNSTFFGSLKSATATARQTSTLNPCHSPFESGAMKPGVPPAATPHFTLPRAFTASSVAPAMAPVGEAAIAAPRRAERRTGRITATSLERQRRPARPVPRAAAAERPRAIRSSAAPPHPVTPACRSARGLRSVAGEWA